MKDTHQYTSSAPTARTTRQSIRVIVTSLFFITLLAACVSATGPKFNGLASTVPDQGDVYLYRTWAYYSGGSAFDVFVDDNKIDSLPNASYLHLRLTPGQHKLKVKPPVMAKISELTIDVEAGRASFYQFDFLTGLFANILFLGSSIESREESKALDDLKELQAAK